MILCFALTILLALTGFLILVLIQRFKPGAEHRRPSSPPLSTDLDTVDCDADMEIVRVPLPEPTFLSNAAQYSINTTSGGGMSATVGESAATIRYPTLGRANRVLRNSHHGGDNGSTSGGGGGGSTVSPTPPRDTVVRYSTIGRHRISPNGGGSGSGGNGPMYFGASGGGGVSGGMMMYGGGGGAPIYAPGSAYSGVSNHSSYLDADLADPRSLTRSQQSDFPFYD
jgi:hypothetical protein